MVRAEQALAEQPRRKEALLPLSFYARDTVTVARELLGKVIEARTSGGAVSGRIVETEAYRADDPASHSFRGPTPRASLMFGAPGVAYVYFIYGMYEMLNFVTEPKGSAGAVLIRALEPLNGIERMARRRGLAPNARGLTSGPGKLCRALGIELAHNGASLRGPRLLVRDDGFRPGSVSVSPRVGIRVGTEAPWRFFVTGNPYVSRAPQNRESVEVAR